MWCRPEGRGFTLIELLVVLVVIAILAGLVGPMVFGHVGEAKQQAARAQIELFGLALDAYRLDNDAYPTTDQGLQALRTMPGIGLLPPCRSGLMQQVGERVQNPSAPWWPGSTIGIIPLWWA